MSEGEQVAYMSWYFSMPTPGTLQTGHTEKAKVLKTIPHAWHYHLVTLENRDAVEADDLFVDIFWALGR